MGILKNPDINQYSLKAVRFKIKKIIEIKANEEIIHIHDKQGLSLKDQLRLRRL